MAGPGMGSRNPAFARAWTEVDLGLSRDHCCTGGLAAARSVAEIEMCAPYRFRSTPAVWLRDGWFVVIADHNPRRIHSPRRRRNSSKLLTLAVSKSTNRSP